MSRIHAILTSLGTDGDVFPFVGLGTALRRRGHAATLVAAEPYRRLAESAGLGFAPLVSREENDRCFGHPALWDPVRGPVHAARWGVRLLPRQVDLFASLARDDATGRPVLVTSPGVVAARVVQDWLGTPAASVVLQPWLLASSTAPPVMPLPFSTLPRWAPRAAAGLYWRGVDAAGGMLMGGPLNAIRRRLGLSPVRRVFRWWMSPDLVLGLFPPAFGPPQADWAPQARLTGFPAFEGMTGGLDPDLAAFCDAPGGRPVAFTFGTGFGRPESRIRAAVAACRAIGARGVLVTRHADRVPADLPPTVRHARFAPFRALFARCAAVVHHGGVGTLAAALAARVPQLVLPTAFDQRDNATRLARLGAGRWVSAARADGQAVATALAPLLTPAARDAARQAGDLTASKQDPVDAAAALVEELAARPATSETHPCLG